MRGTGRRRLRRYAITTVIAAAPAAVLCAYVTNLLVPTEPTPRPASYEYIPTAGIKEESTTIGIADSDLYGKTEAEIIAHFDDMQALGVTDVRVLVPWGDIKWAEPGSAFEIIRPPNWDKIDFILSQAQERNMSVLGVLNATPYWGTASGQTCVGCPGAAPDPTKFAAFAKEAATRFNNLFPGVVSAYEVWNEPNSYKSWSPAVDPVAYTNLVKAAYTAIKDANGILGADPTDPMVVAGVLGAVVTFGGFTMDPVTFVNTMYANGAKGFFDALSYHPYNYSRTFAEQNPSFTSPLRMLLQMRQTMLANGDDLVKIWATEYGLPTHLNANQELAYLEQERFIRDFLNVWGEGLTDAQIAQLPAQFREMAANWEDWIGPAFIYTLRDRLGLENTEQGSLGLYYFDEATGEWKMKPAAEYIRDLIRERAGNDLAQALAESLQKLVEQVADTVAAVVQNQVVPQVTQGVQQLGAQIGNALANAIAAWANSFKNPPATTTTTLAAVEAVDTAAVAEQAVADALGTTPEAAPALGAGLGAPTEEAAAAPAEEVTEPVEETVTEPVVEEEPAVVETEEPAVVETEVPVVVETEEPEVVETEVPEVIETEEPAVVETDEPETSEEPDTATPGRNESEDEPTTDPDEEGDGDADTDADGTTDGGRHAEGNVENGVSVDEIQDRLDSEADAGNAGTDGAAGSDGAAGADGADGSDGAADGDNVSFAGEAGTDGLFAAA